jgi:UDP-N-acetyl-D-mannosaminuronate dehydrogenase
MQAFISDPHVDQHILDSLFGDRVVGIIEGIQKVDIVVFLVAHDRFKVIDRKLLDHKQIIDYCGVLYQSSLGNADEEHYWPTPGVMDFFVTNQAQGESE